MPRAPPDGSAAPSRMADPIFPGTGVATTWAPEPRAAAHARAASAAVSSSGPPNSSDAAGGRRGGHHADVRSHLVDVDRLQSPAHRHRQYGPSAGRLEQRVDEAVELGHPQQGHRQAGGQQNLLGGELGPVVAERDPVDTRRSRCRPGAAAGRGPLPGPVAGFRRRPPATDRPRDSRSPRAPRSPRRPARPRGPDRWRGPRAPRRVRCRAATSAVTVCPAPCRGPTSRRPR